MENLIEKSKKFWTKERLYKLNGGRKLLLSPDHAPELLRVMGLLSSDASMSANKIRKYRQINHSLALLSEDLKELTHKSPVLRIVDMACGNSYMSFLLVWYFKNILKHPVECIGLDSQEKVIQASQERAKILNYDTDLKFIKTDIQNADWSTIYSESFAKEASRPHFVIALHACDSATDYVLNFAVENKTDLIALAPCCQAELAREWKDRVDPEHPFAPIFRSPHFRREIAAQITDVYRMLRLRSRGYEVTATEFVSHEHAHKNRLLLAKRRGKRLPEAEVQLKKLEDFFNEKAPSIPHL